MLETIKPIIVSLRRGEDPEGNFRRFSETIENRLEEVCAELSTRWLISVCDTYADFGSAVERRNAMFVSMLANFEKIAQSYAYWRLGYPDTLAAPEGLEHRKIDLWDGMKSFHLDIGDVSNNLFRRLDGLITETPVIYRIYQEVLKRIKEGDTILGNLNKRHHHVFETDLEWRKSPAYDEWRKLGRIP